MRRRRSSRPSHVSALTARVSKRPWSSRKIARASSAPATSHLFAATSVGCAIAPTVFSCSGGSSARKSFWPASRVITPSHASRRSSAARSMTKSSASPVRARLPSHGSMWSTLIGGVSTSWICVFSNGIIAGRGSCVV